MQESENVFCGQSNFILSTLPLSLILISTKASKSLKSEARTKHLMHNSLSFLKYIQFKINIDNFAYSDLSMITTRVLIHDGVGK